MGDGQNCGNIFQDTGNDEVQSIREGSDFNKEWFFLWIVIAIIISNNYFHINLVSSRYFCLLRVLWFPNDPSSGKIMYAVAERLFQHVQIIGQVQEVCGGN